MSDLLSPIFVNTPQICNLNLTMNTRYFSSMLEICLHFFLLMSFCVSLKTFDSVNVHDSLPANHDQMVGCRRITTTYPYNFLLRFLTERAYLHYIFLNLLYLFSAFPDLRSQAVSIQKGSNYEYPISFRKLRDLSPIFLFNSMLRIIKNF